MANTRRRRRFRTRSCVHNRGRTLGWPTASSSRLRTIRPTDGGFKYNPPNGGPADTDVTGWIEARANALLEDGWKGVRRIPFDRARAAHPPRASTISSAAYVADLGSVIDFDAIRGSGIRMGVDPLGGAGVHYWARIAERYGIDLTVVSDEVDPTFALHDARLGRPHPHGPVVGATRCSG